VLNCEGLAERPVESDFFNHRSDWFSGRIELGNCGTLLLDHISKMTPTLQISLLHFIKEQRSQGTEGNGNIGPDVRLIAASDPNLGAALASHQFREDLYYRLGTITLEIPPLREHSNDIAPLAERMLSSLALRHHRSRLRLPRKVMDALAKYHWPGNILELRNAIERAVVLCPDETVTLQYLPRMLSQDRQSCPQPGHRQDNRQDSANGNRKYVPDKQMHRIVDRTTHSSSGKRK
jgi:DNA-binding NtrC family response regulator